MANPAGAYIMGACAVLGAYSVLRSTYSVLGSFKRHYLRSAHNFMQRYGKKDSWVLVTGGSDGIGLEISNQMAAQGFNVCIVSRTLSKIETKCQEIEATHKVKTRAIEFDFSKLVTISDYKTLIADKVKDIDVAMVFLNAGFIAVGEFRLFTD